MNGPSSESFSLEEDRIRAAYVKRNDDLRYSWFNSGHLFAVQERERRLLTRLLQQFDIA